MAKTTTEAPVRSGWREIAGILVGTVGLMLLLGVFSYNPADIGLFRNTLGSHNWIGPFGARTAYAAFMYFGVAGYVIPFCILWIGVSSVFWSARKIYPRLLWFVLGLFCLAGLMDMQQIWFSTVERLNIGSPGGLMGEVLAQRSLGYWIGSAGAGIVFTVLLAISIIRMLDLHIIDLVKRLWGWIKTIKMEAPSAEEVFTPKEETKPGRKRAPRKSKKTAPVAEQGASSDQIITMVEAQEKRAKKKPVKSEPAVEIPLVKPSRPKKGKTEEAAEITISLNEGGEQTDYRLPSLDLLDPVTPQAKGMSASEIAETAQVLQQALEEFNVEAKVTGYQQGPVVTCYEIQPAPGVRVEKIKSLADNLKLKMHAESLRIQAPIPGRGVCGVEVPNTARADVLFRDMVSCDDFRHGKSALPLVLGKDVSGDSMIYDLAKMPHLLIAGATGAGKSVCMNSILTGLLMKHSPADMRLILVDPKTVEFHSYNNLPHLVVPVITNAKKVSLGLRWAIDEMERRFKWFRLAGVRDLQSFNARVIQKQEELFGDEVVEEPAKKKDQIPEKLPYIVIVIDELADLMAVAQAEIEAGIARLAAKSRAAGIHMILATQRPDVKVITGTIKANFPVRIAFKVSQKVDSRTILDRMGADTLLGKGDMLVLPPGSDKLIRSQGAFTSDGEIDRVTNFWKEQSQPEFIAEIHDKIEKPSTDLPDMDSGEDDDIVEQAMEVIRQTKRASTSSLQRRLRIGYTRAARVMDLLEERGVIGPPDGAGPREILIDLDGEIPQNTGAEDDATN
ncbi:DNA translocase FtsK [Pontiella sulfatireligans]|uniref:DNA translocase SpoIIIE n=1 Tax=Pontiella sulfatireligans TaxID=2750658 RepID=A0A6C2UJW1_9BACT|nr:DNA translocase FtsK [Pontiella sulfatireligans]VGO20522.1 DNA translocase SpoIIIE [Pontiella sulfatireligans]